MRGRAPRSCPALCRARHTRRRVGHDCDRLARVVQHFVGGDAGRVGREPGEEGAVSHCRGRLHVAIAELDGVVGLRRQSREPSAGRQQGQAVDDLPEGQLVDDQRERQLAPARQPLSDFGELDVLSRRRIRLAAGLAESGRQYGGRPSPTRCFHCHSFWAERGITQPPPIGMVHTPRQTSGEAHSSSDSHGAEQNGGGPLGAS
jgi:hypothetical protein